MSELIDSRPSKVQRRSGHSALASEASRDEHEHELERGSVMVGRCLRGSVVSRSGLLAGIGDTDGVAAVPGDFSSDDIQLWHTACTLPFHPSHNELVTIMKVADVVSDSGPNAESWTRLLSQRVADTDWQDAQAANDMLAALLQLPDHLIHQVLTRCIASRQFRPLLAELPLPLHAALISAQILAKRQLSIPDKNINSFLTTLSTTTVPPPGLTSISTPRAEVLTTATAALLARALAAHPSLSLFRMNNSPIQPTALRMFVACMPANALPALRALGISVSAHPGGCAALVECMRRLPAVTSLHADMMFDKVVDSSQPASAHYLQAAFTPACLPNLAHLSICEQVSVAAGKNKPHASCILLILPMTLTPSLTQLTIESTGTSLSGPDLAAAICRLQSLQKLDINFSVNAACGWTCETLCPPRFTTLPALRSLTIAGETHKVTTSMAAALVQPAVQTLTSLDVGLWYDYVEPQASVARRGKQADFPRMLEQLRRCTALQQLKLEVLPVMCLSMARGPGALSLRDQTEWCIALGDVLQQLTALTRLSLRATDEDVSWQGGCMLDAAAIARALGVLTGLQELSISGTEGGGLVSADEPQVLLDACVGLSQLQCLDMCVRGLQYNAVLTAAPRLTHLKVLSLPYSIFSIAAGQNVEGGAGADAFDLLACLKALLPQSDVDFR